MPKQNDIKSVMIIGAGPIVIGQACEFDYSGTQACRALKEEGLRVILMNSNPATIMTDPEIADATYIEPISVDFAELIIAKERPDALLPTMGGQTALNTALELEKKGVLKKYGVKLIGADAKVIDKAEDRQKFRDAMVKIGLETPRAMQIKHMDQADEAMEYVGFPIILRPAFTLGGLGGGIAYNREEYRKLVDKGLRASPTSAVLVEESVLGWKEFEMEVVRDKADNCIIVCSIENIDPMGVHTGDSVTVAPALTLTDKEYQRMRDASIAVLREIGVDTGGSNVQFAINPKDGRMVVIEMNPRVSRSSALASKATGFPIAKIATKLAIGYHLDELENTITGGVIPASFEPSIDYIVVKVPRFTFEKFPGISRELGTSMKSVGEVMAIGRSFPEAMQKAMRSLETGFKGFDDIEILGAPDRDAVKAALARAVPARLRIVAQAIRHGISLAEIAEITHIDLWFLRQIAEIINAESQLLRSGVTTPEHMMALKRLGFSDERLAQLCGKKPAYITKRRHKMQVFPVFKRIDSCAAEFASLTPYMYSTYHHYGMCEALPSEREKVIILGGGPNRIGQGIEFDYCCVHASFALRDAGFETIMINCNPETISTDYDTSDRLYFEPLTPENVLDIIRKEQESGELKGVIVQFGGQTPLKLAKFLAEQQVPIIGTSPGAIDLAEDRELFQKLLKKHKLRQPPNGVAKNLRKALAIARKIGFPIVIRPSYVLGGRAMEIVHNPEDLEKYIKTAVRVSGKNPVLIDHYLQDAIEVDVDALCDGNTVFVAGVMEHIEEAGVHSGDSACSLPAYSLEQTMIAEIERQTETLALALGVCGLINIQFAVQKEKVFVLEVNPRASRTVPFIAKATGEPIAKYAARLAVGEKLADMKMFNFPKPEQQFPKQQFYVKESVFPFTRFPGADVLLGPEMRSTGEVMGWASDFGSAFAKAQIAAGMRLPEGGKVFISVKDYDKMFFVDFVRRLYALGFEICATSGTVRSLAEHGVDVARPINKVLEGSPHIVDEMINGGIQLVFNTTDGKKAIEDSRELRQTALLRGIPYCTTRAGARAIVMAFEAMRRHEFTVSALAKPNIG